MHLVATAIEVAGVAIIVAGVLIASALFLRHGVGSSDWEKAYEGFRADLGRGILLGLEFLVAADIIGTVAVAPISRLVASRGHRSDPNVPEFLSGSGDRGSMALAEAFSPRGALMTAAPTDMRRRTMATEVFDIVVRLVAAGFLGACIGFERRIHHKAIGIAGMVLIAIGSTTYMLLGRHLAGLDPSSISRTLQGFLSGIGFLGGPSSSRAVST